MEPLLKATGITKWFGENRALNQVDFQLFPGEIHGLVGANGSGKSTLLNILCGNRVIQETGGYQGNLFLQGNPVKIRSASESRQLGIGMVHQEFSLIGDMSVAANICLGQEPVVPLTEQLLGTEFACVSDRTAQEEAQGLLERMDIPLKPNQRVETLGVNLKQFVEVAREMSRDIKILMLDEPTASLGEEDAKKLTKLLMELKQSGIGIIFISHRLDELIACCDRITVFRDGEVRATYSQEGFKAETIAQAMVGGTFEKAARHKRELESDPLLILENFSSHGAKPFSLSIRKGEILGLTGLAGHGHHRIPYGLMGLTQWTGQGWFNQREIPRDNPEWLIQQGMFFLPDERKELGLLLKASIQENIAFTARQTLGLFGCWAPIRGLQYPRTKDEAQYAHTMVQQLGIRCMDVGQPVGELSGGNQQKVCIARALALNPKLVFVGEPTRGMDIQAKELILNHLLEMNRKHDTTLVIASGELEELRRTCDRIAVFQNGSLTGIFDAEADESLILGALAGQEDLK